MRRSALFLAAALLAVAPAHAIEPKSIRAAKQVKPGQGALRLSVQSQVQQGGTIHLWFLREGGDPSRSADLLKFERKQGVPLVGTNTVDSKPLVYGLAPGRYRLLGYGVACGGLPPVGASGCLARMNGMPIGTMPARRYSEQQVPIFEIAAGKLSDAGEFILEASPGAPISEQSAFRHGQKQPGDFHVRVRPLPAQAVGFASLPAGPAVEVPETFVSRITCRQRPQGAMMYLPFSC